MEKIQHQWWISYVIQAYRVLDIPSGAGFCVVVQWCLMYAISTSASVKAMTSRMRRMSSSQFRDKTFVEIFLSIARNDSPSSKQASVADESSQDELVTFHCFPGLKVRICFWPGENLLRRQHRSDPWQFSGKEFNGLETVVGSHGAMLP